jgi:hypothetical protein
VSLVENAAKFDLGDGLAVWMQIWPPASWTI